MSELLNISDIFQIFSYGLVAGFIIASGAPLVSMVITALIKYMKN